MSVIRSENWPAYLVCAVKEFSTIERLFVVAQPMLQPLQQQRRAGVAQYADPKLVCRRLMTLHADVMAIPQAKGYVGLLVDRRQYCASSLHLLLDKLQLRRVSVEPATAEQLKSCWLHWLQVRLSPHWSTVAGHLAHHDNFLDTNEDDTSLKFAHLSVHPTDGAGVEIRARIGQMRVYPVGPGDLHVGRSALDRFSRDPSAVISIDPTMNHTFFYLPKLKSGKLVSVTRRIPSSSPFRRYEELCQYWSQVYGYALPEDCSEMVYFNVEMTRNGAVFTYPSCCVYSQLPKEMDAEVDPEPILRQLWKSLSNVMKLYEERLVPILQSLPQPLSIQGKLSRSSMASKRRRPWCEKLSDDLEAHTEWLQSYSNALATDGSKFSPYFKAPVGVGQRRSEAIPQPSQSVANRQPRLISSRITEYFGLKRPSNVTIKRPTNKIPFQGFSPNEGQSKPKTARFSIEDLAQLGKLDRSKINQLRAWLKQRDIPFHPKSNHQELCLLVYEQFQSKTK